MNTMKTPSKPRKRSASINLSRMRKAFALKPLSIGLAGIMLSACADKRQEAELFTSVDDCTNGYPGLADVCESAYEQAVKDAEETGPKYEQRSDCEYDFGANQCRQQNTMFGSYYMPLMAGYLVGNMMSRRPYYQPMYTSTSRRNPLYNRFFTPSGVDVGSSSRDKFKVRPSVFDKGPIKANTMRRGGFGKMVRSSSSYRASGKGWGG